MGSSRKQSRIMLIITNNVWGKCHMTFLSPNAPTTDCHLPSPIIAVSLSVSAQILDQPPPHIRTVRQPPHKNLCNKTVNCAAFTVVCLSYSQLATVTHERAGSQPTKLTNLPSTSHLPLYPDYSSSSTSYLCNVFRVTRGDTFLRVT